MATLARDHEFTFLDHALKSGDSLVGLTATEIGNLSWDAKVTQPLLSGHIKERVETWRAGRQAVRSAPDDVALALQEVTLRQAERSLTTIRNVGDALVSTFFAAEKGTTRKKALEAFQVIFTSRAADCWDVAARMAADLRTGNHPIAPFHWQIEFPEVFGRDNPGFDLIVGNPPFAGKNTIAKGNRAGYGQWLQWRHDKTHGNADLVAHFFRRAEGLLRKGGGFGLIASNTIAQGDTRESGLRQMIAHGTVLYRAERRLKWPGEAAVVVSVVHGVKKPERVPPLRIDGRPVARVSAFLVSGENDDSPMPLASNEADGFIGSYILGMGFTFDDVAAQKGTANSLAEMERLIAENPRNAERILPYLGGEEVNNHPRHEHHRYVIDFEDFPLRRDPKLQSWFMNAGSEACEKRRREWLRNGIVPTDYPDPVAADWPELLKIVETLVKPERDGANRDALRERWWQYAEKRPGLRSALRTSSRTLVLSRVSPRLGLAFVSPNVICADSCVQFVNGTYQVFASLQGNAHELWARFFASSMKDDLRYSPSDCFATFPFPEGFQSDPELEAIGQTYHDHRAQLIVDSNKGLTPTYNRFHDPYDDDPAIQRLRDLHAEMDRAVLRAYGWDDLAEAAQPVFLTEETETEFTYQGRLFWPSDFRDEVLARLLDLNRARHAAEANAGIAIATAPDAPHSAATDRIRARQMDFGLDAGPLFDRTSE